MTNTVEAGAQGAVDNSEANKLPDRFAGITGESTTHPQNNETQEPVKKPEGDAADQNADNQNSGDGSDDEGADDAPKKENGWKRQRNRLKEQNQQLLAEIAALRSGQPQAQPQQNSPNTASKEPQMADFENVLDYVQAYAKWQSAEAVNAFKTEQQKQAESAKINQLASEYDERAEEFAQQHPDFEEKVAQIIQTGLVTPEIRQAVLHSDISEKVAYHLANYPSDLVIMQNLQGNPQGLRQAIMTIEAFIENQAKTSPAVKQTNAAPPISPVTAPTGKSQKKPEDMSQEDFERWRYPDRFKGR